MRYLAGIIAVFSMVASAWAQEEDRDYIQSAPVSPVIVAKPTVPLHSEVIDSKGGGAIPALPLEVKTSGSVKYVSGGVGDEEMAQLKAIGQEYNLHLLLTAKSGEYITGVNFRVLGEGGKEVLSMQGAGPYVFVKLPAGSYTLEATWAGITKKASVSLSDKKISRPHLAF